jgi:hypothetical protein
MVPLNVGSVVGDGICDPKVDQLELSTDKNEIRGLEVRMHDLLFMDNVHGLEHLVIATHTSALVGKGIKKDTTCCQ